MSAHACRIAPAQLPNQLNWKGNISKLIKLVMIIKESKDEKRQHFYTLLYTEEELKA